MGDPFTRGAASISSGVSRRSATSRPSGRRCSCSRPRPTCAARPHDNEQLFIALRHLGRTVEYVLYPDESHVFGSSGRPDRRIDRNDADPRLVRSLPARLNAPASGERVAPRPTVRRAATPAVAS